MSYTVTPLDLRSAIAAALSGHLGTYTFSNGETRDAFSAGDGSYQSPAHPWQFGPEIPRVEGLEAILEIDADSPSRTPLLAGQYWMYRIAKLTLKQYDPTKTTRAAADALEPALNSVPAFNLRSVRVPRMPPLNNVETQAFTFNYSVK